MSGSDRAACSCVMDAALELSEKAGKHFNVPSAREVAHRCGDQYRARLQPFSVELRSNDYRGRKGDSVLLFPRFCCVCGEKLWPDD